MKTDVGIHKDLPRSYIVVGETVAITGIIKEAIKRNESVIVIDDSGEVSSYLQSKFSNVISAKIGIDIKVMPLYDKYICLETYISWLEKFLLMFGKGPWRNVFSYTLVDLLSEEKITLSEILEALENLASESSGFEKQCYASLRDLLRRVFLGKLLEIFDSDTESLHVKTNNLVLDFSWLPSDIHKSFFKGLILLKLVYRIKRPEWFLLCVTGASKPFKHPETVELIELLLFKGFRILLQETLLEKLHSQAYRLVDMIISQRPEDLRRIGRKERVYLAYSVFGEINEMDVRRQIPVISEISWEEIEADFSEISWNWEVCKKILEFIYSNREITLNGLLLHFYDRKEEVLRLLKALWRKRMIKREKRGKDIVLRLTIEGLRALRGGDDRYER